mmetsp:Transcript_162003/g.519403  ORF Transcript_162003/g.519403 Transcript_162003/m.519403 type:complete len:252 (+) Transcript_162003:708-1463(+)
MEALLGARERFQCFDQRSRQADSPLEGAPDMYRKRALGAGPVRIEDHDGQAPRPVLEADLLGDPLHPELAAGRRLSGADAAKLVGARGRCDHIGDRHLDGPRAVGSRHLPALAHARARHRARCDHTRHCLAAAQREILECCAGAVVGHAGEAVGRDPHGVQHGRRRMRERLALARRAGGAAQAARAGLRGGRLFLRERLERLPGPQAVESGRGAGPRDEAARSAAKPDRVLWRVHRTRSREPMGAVHSDLG